MISASTGEVTFEKLRITPRMFLTLTATQKLNPLPIQGWFHHNLELQHCEHGAFDVEVVSDPEDRVQLALLSHFHPFYQPGTEEDSERRVYHEEVILRDLRGQREFSWGQVFCRVHPGSNRDWLIAAYSVGPHIPQTTSEILSHLRARRPTP